MRQFKKTLVAPSSALGKALSEKPKDRKLHEQIYNQTSKNFDALYPEGHRQWFENYGTEDKQ